MRYSYSVERCNPFKEGAWRGPLGRDVNEFLSFEKSALFLPTELKEISTNAVSRGDYEPTLFSLSLI
jgi:hypothetical protein